MDRHTDEKSDTEVGAPPKKTIFLKVIDKMLLTGFSRNLLVTKERLIRQ